MTLLEKLSVLSHVLESSTENFRHINTASSFFINTLPQFIAEDFYIEEEIDENGLKCGLKYSGVVRDGIPCRKIPSSIKRRLNNNNSAYFIDENDPVFYKENGKIFVKPDPKENEKAFVLKIPTSFIPEGSDPSLENIPNIPEEAENVILIYSAFLIVSSKFRSLSFPQLPEFNDTIDQFDISFPDIADLSVDISFDLSSINELISPNIGDDSFQFDSERIEEGLNALNNAFKFIGSITTTGSGNEVTDVPTGAFWLDDEDPEMVQSASQLAAQEINRANSYFGNRASGLNSYRTLVDGKVAEFQSKVQLEIQKISAKVQVISSEIESKRLLLEKHGVIIQEVNMRLQKFQIDVQQRLQKNQQLLERFSQSLQSYQLEYSTLAQESISLFERYRIELSNFLGINESQ